MKSSWAKYLFVAILAGGANAFFLVFCFQVVSVARPSLLGAMIPMAGLIGLVGIASLWAACSRRHWYTRTAVVAAALLPALLTPGLDVVVMLFFQAVLLVLVLRVLWPGTLYILSHLDWVEWKPRGNGAADGGSPWRYTLADLMFFSVVVALVGAVAAQVSAVVWQAFPWVLLVALLGVMAVVWLPIFVMDLTGRESFGRLPHRPKKKPVERALNLLALPGSACFIGFLAALGMTMIHLACHPPLPPTDVAVPEDNGYDDLVRAGSRLEEAGILDADTMTDEQLAALLAAESETLALARRALDRPCRVPPSPAPDGSGSSDLGTTWMVCQAFLSEGDLARRQGRDADALTSYLDTLRAVRSGQVGGELLDFLVTNRLANSAITALGEGLDRWDHGQIARLAEGLQSYDERREPTAAILHRVEIHSLREAPFAERAGQSVFQIPPTYPGLIELLEYAHHRDRCCTLLLRTEIALHRYHDDRDAWPERLEDLVPRFLGVVPIDPYAAGPLRYRRTPTGFDLYSVGPDQVDDGGAALAPGGPGQIDTGDVHLREPAWQASEASEDQQP